jgi:hypothetical protein
MDGMDKNGLLNGRWTMDDGQRLCRALSGLCGWMGIRTQGVALGWYVTPLQG